MRVFFKSKEQPILVSRLLLEHTLSQSVINEHIISIVALEWVMTVLGICNSPLRQYMSTFTHYCATSENTIIPSPSSFPTSQSTTGTSDYPIKSSLDLSQRNTALGPILDMFRLSPLAPPAWSARLIKKIFDTRKAIFKNLDVIPRKSLSALYHIYRGLLFTLAKDITPQLSEILLIQGVQIEDAKGPEGETVWHAVVKYHQRADDMLDWLLQNSHVPCHSTSSDGNTPLMLALKLGRVNAAKKLSRYSDLNVLNPSTKLTAPELAARSQSHESVDIFNSMMENLPLNEDWGRKLAKRIPRAIRDGLFAYEKKLRVNKLRKDKHCTSQVQQQAYYNERQISIAECYALQKVHSFGLAMKASGSHSNTVG